jgi:hypothetical protein
VRSVALMFQLRTLDAVAALAASEKVTKEVGRLRSLRTRKPRQRGGAHAASWPDRRARRPKALSPSFCLFKSESGWARRILMAQSCAAPLRTFKDSRHDRARYLDQGRDCAASSLRPYS